MGCGTSNANNDDDFMKDDYLNSLPSELSLEIINSHRKNGNFAQNLQALRQISTDITEQNPNSFQDEKDTVFLIICTTKNPETKEEYNEKINDSILTAKSAQLIGYQAFSLIDPKSTQLLSFLRVFLSTTKRSLFIFFNSFYKGSQSTLSGEKEFKMVWSNEKVKFSIISESLQAFKVPTSKVRLFFDCNQIGEISFEAKDLQIIENTSCFTGTSITPLTFLLWKEMRNNKSATIKNLFNDINNLAINLDGGVSYQCNPEEDENLPVIAIANEQFEI